MTSKSDDLLFTKIFNESVSAGLNAGNSCVPVPMRVGTAKSLFSNEIDYSKPTEIVSDGVCGFAWVKVKPGTSKFARWLKEKDLAYADSYAGGVNISIHNYNQSMTRKEEHARAMAQVLRNYGFNAYAQSRID